MHIHNALFGQRAMLARYTGRQPQIHSKAVAGHLQHSVDWGHGCPQEPVNPAGVNSYVWSRAVARRRASAGRGDADLVIGAPWLYLELAIEREQAQRTTPPPPLPEPAGMYWLPGLTGPGAPATGHILDSGDPAQITVALPAGTPETVRQGYAAAGLRCESLPEAGDADTGGGIGYLPTLRARLNRYQIVASDTLSPELLYAASLGKQIIYTDTPGPARLFAPGVTEPDEARAIADIELGRDSLLGPDELAVLLEWIPT